MMRAALRQSSALAIVQHWHGQSRRSAILRVVRGLFRRGSLPLPVDVAQALQVVDEGQQLDLILTRLHAARSTGGAPGLLRELARLEEVLDRRYGVEFQPAPDPRDWLAMCHKYDFDGCGDG